MTTLSKGSNGWKAEDELDFDGPYRLHIETYKNPGGTGLLSRVHVSKHAGGMMTHAFGLAGGGDYSARLIVDQTKRCTEKSVAAQHHDAMKALPEVQAAARAHYAKYPVKVEA